MSFVFYGTDPEQAIKKEQALRVTGQTQSSDLLTSDS